MQPPRLLCSGEPEPGNMQRASGRYAAALTSHTDVARRLRSCARVKQSRFARPPQRVRLSRREDHNASGVVHQRVHCLRITIEWCLRLVVVGTPAYFARRARPKHPRELVEHDCINWHRTPDAPPYRWEFTEKGREFSVAVPMRVLTTDPALLIRLASASVGLAFVYEDQVRAEIATGALVPVLQEFSTPFPGFRLYYPTRRQASPALRALIDHFLAAQHGRRVRRRSG